MPPPVGEAVRLDAWLWAARCFKTRTLATEAVRGGHVKIDGERMKAARDVKVGDVIEVTSPTATRVLVVRALGTRRGSPAAAALLYEETPESIARREAAREQQRLAPVPGLDLVGRPTKRDRRRIDEVRRRSR